MLEYPAKRDWNILQRIRFYINNHHELCTLIYHERLYSCATLIKLDHVICHVQKHIQLTNQIKNRMLYFMLIVFSRETKMKYNKCCMVYNTRSIVSNHPDREMTVKAFPALECHS